MSKDEKVDIETILSNNLGEQEFKELLMQMD